MEVSLHFFRDSEFIGDIYLGSPHSQRATVVIDTGSSWLNVKSHITDKHSHINEHDKKEYKYAYPSFLKHYRKKILRDPTNTHNGTVYYLNKTQTGSETDRANNFNLGYGSAELDGWRYNDYMCLRPLPNSTNSSYDLT